MSLLNKLPKKNIKLNKKRSIVTIIGIMLSVALMTAVSTMYSSGIKSLIKYEISEMGNYYVGFHDVPINDLDTFKNSDDISEISLTQDYGYADIETKNEYKPYVYIKGYNKDALDNITPTLVDGRLPENENEIVIPTHLKTNGNNDLKVGDSIDLNIGQRVDGTGNVLTQETPYPGDDSPEKESVINTTTKTYKVVGIVERPSRNIEEYDAPGYTFITYLDDNKLGDKVNVYVRYTKAASKKWAEITADFLGLDRLEYDSIDGFMLYKIAEDSANKKYEFDVNDYLILLETNPIGAISEGVILVSIIIAIIVFTSVFCIKNSFDISITEKIKQYGMLRSIGATKKQIRKNVFSEATILGSIGILLGLFFGCFATFILIIVCNHFMAEGDMLLVYSVSPGAILVSIILGIVTIYLSASKAARRASKVSPIDTIRNSAVIKINPKKIKSPKFIKKIFGMGGEISYKNLKRNKKKYRTTVISIVVSAFSFIALSSFVGMMFKIVRAEGSDYDYNIYVNGSLNDSNAQYDKYLSITRLENIEDCSVYRDMRYEVSDIKYNKDYLDYIGVSYEDYVGSRGELCLNVYSLDDNQYQKYVKSLGLNYDDIKDKAILMDQYDEANMRVYDYQVGDEITNKETNKKLQVGYVTDVNPFGLKDRYDQYLLVSDAMFDNLLDGELAPEILIYIQSSNADKLQDDIDQVLKNESHYYIRNIDENIRQRENFVILMSIFLYGFIIVITLIGLTNIFNTITTNMELRKPEFAMLKSVGMTTPEFNRMIRLETLFMGVKALFFGLPIGIGLSYLIYMVLIDDPGIPYQPPIKSIITTIVAVFFLISLIMNYSMGKISKQNTIETIRNENI